jgi:murein L,D-transpeptidase YafK
MQTHNLKLPKKYRDTSSNFYIKVGIGLIALLVIFNLILLALFIKETKKSGKALLILQETSRSLVLLQDSLSRVDMQKAFVHLADARRQIAAALPPAPVASPAKAVTESKPPPVKTVAESKGEPVKPPVVAQKPAIEPVKPPVVAQKPAVEPVKTTQLSIPAGEMPAPFGSAVTGEYALICEKESKLLHLFKFQDERFALVKSYPCIIGANGTDKQKAGDYATPKGSYFTLSYTPGSALQEIYGEGAFVLNYPNFLDRKVRKNGGGIWIHGHVRGKVVGMGDLVNTKGCIAVSNETVKELKNLLNPSGTQVSIVDKVTFVKESSRKESLQEVRNFMDAWRQAWESGDTGKYLRYYSRDFINSEGMDFAAFKRHKERVNSGKKFIRVKVEQVAIVFPQEREGEMATVRFVQKYSSNNFESHSKKLFYLKKGQAGWTIFGESAF